MSIEYLKFKAGKNYRLIKVPGHSAGVDTDGWPALSTIGECRWVSSINGVCMNFGGEDLVMPFDCLDEPYGSTKPINPNPQADKIEDAILVTIMLENPEGVLKLLRGLWRMTKHITIRDLMERGTLPKDEDQEPKVPLKAREECDKNWEQCKSVVKTDIDTATDPWEDYCRMSGMINEGGMVCSD